MKNRVFRIIAGCILIAQLGGCASGAMTEGMVYTTQKYRFAPDLVENIKVDSVSGGEKTNPLWASEISSEAFKGALQESLKEQGLLSGSGIYRLDVQMVKVDKPLFGLDLKVTTTVKYFLTDVKTGKSVFEEAIVASHTATFDDAAMAIKRLRLANEGSAKKNIESLMEKLSSLEIKKEPVSISN